MRKLLISLLVIVLLIVILPVVTGQIAKNKFMEFVNAASRSPNVKLEVNNYHRGWFQSTADVAISTTNNLPQVHLGGPLTFTVHQVIKHGPILLEDHNILFGYALARSQFELSDKIKAALSDFIPAGQTLPIIKTEIFFPFNGGGSVKSTIPAFILEKAQQGKFSWKDSVAHINYNREMTRVAGDVMVDGFVFTSIKPQIVAQHDGSKLTFQMQQVDGLWVGNGDMDFSKLQVQMEGKETFLLSGVKTHSESSIADHLFGMSFQILLDKWQQAGQAYGPGKLIVTINKLNAEALLNIKQHLEAANDPNINDQQRQLMVMAVLPLLPSLLDKAPEFQLHTLTLQSAEGELRANGHLVIADDVPGHKGLMSMLKRINGELNMEVPKKIVEKWLLSSLISKMQQEQSVQAVIAEEAAKTQKQPSTTVPATRLTDAQIESKANQEMTTQLAEWVKNGYLIVDGDSYKLNASYQNQELKINGKSLDHEANAN